MKKITILLIILFLTSSVICAAAEPMHATAVKKTQLASPCMLPVLESESDSVLDRAVFFGDSTTYGLLRYNVNNTGEHGTNYHTLKASQIWVPKDGTFYLGNLLSARVCLSNGQNLSLSEAASTVQPEYLIITVGINGLCSWNQETFCKYYEKMVDMVRSASPKTTVILQSVYPVAAERSQELSEFTNDKIDCLNRWILEIAERKALPYLNTASVLKDQNGDLRQEYQNGDGLHLNTQGFNAILAYIESNVQP